MAKKKQETKSLEELLNEALVPEEDWPYEVPENWVWTRLEQIINVSSGKGLSQSQMISDGEIPVYGGNGVTGFHNEFNVDDETIIIGRVGVNCGNVHLTEKKAWITDNALIVKYLVNYIDKKFLLHTLKQLNLGQYSNSSAQPVISGRTIYPTDVPIPPHIEQKRIVDKLELLLGKINEAKELIEEAKETFEKRRAAILSKAFRGELTAKWREEKGISLNDWKEKLLGETDIDIIDGDRGTNYPTKEEFSNNGYCLFLNAKNVTKNGFVFDELNFITKEKDDLLRKGKLEKYDIILTTRGTIGNIAYFDESIPYENMRINSGMVIYRGGSEFYKPFLCWLYKSDYISNQIADLSTGSAQPQLPIKIMKRLKLIIPSLIEQKEIVRILDKIFENEQQVKEFYDVGEKIEMVERSILSKAFRGQLGTNNPEEESAIELLKQVLQEKLNKTYN